MTAPKSSIHSSIGGSDAMGTGSESPVPREADAAQRAELPLRQGRVIGWIEEALAPLRAQMTETDVHRLASRSGVTGIEALAWLTDVAGLSSDDAILLMRWSAQAMLRSALDGGAPPLEVVRRTGTVQAGHGEGKA